MKTAQVPSSSADREDAKDGTLHWTLSFYIEPKRVTDLLGCDAKSVHGQFRNLQRTHPPSRALRDAVNPLMNDIADREVMGKVHEFLLAADDLLDGDEHGDRTARGYVDLEFALSEPTLSWQTEGRRYRVDLPDLVKKRSLRLKRFWMAHNNGALSYHLSFIHNYAEERDYSPATYYFLSCLQKLAAPKEYCLGHDRIGDVTDPDEALSIFDKNLDIDPVEKMRVNERDGSEQQAFWPYVKDRLEADAKALFKRLILPSAEAERTINGIVLDRLVDMVPFIEVPGLMVPKSRFMFFLQDQRLFDRLMPFNPETMEPIPRRSVVRRGCLQEFRKRLASHEDCQENGCREIYLKDGFWEAELASHRREGVSSDTYKEDGRERREDGSEQNKSPISRSMAPEAMLDYLFLAGFNQNIIDFLNQDASEVLDATDPLYPKSEDQHGERFFVRFANHRAMITYAESSRSLEFGNDYIGTCPYAFLIHVLALHNEFLGRAYEKTCMEGIESVKTLTGSGDHDRAETLINALKLSEFEEFERYRYDNPFRYDTERDVFKSLEDLRGIHRKKGAIERAIDRLEDNTADLHYAAQSRQQTRLNVILGGLGIYGAGQMIYWIGEKGLSDRFDSTPRYLLGVPYGNIYIGSTLMALVEWAILISTLIFIVMIIREARQHARYGQFKKSLAKMWLKKAAPNVNGSRACENGGRGADRSD